MPYPYTFTDASLVAAYGSNTTSYADVQAVQSMMMSYKIRADQDDGNIRQVQQYLVWVSREIDALLMSVGVLVPPPLTAPIIPILTQTAALGASAMLAHARFESGDEILGSHANQLMGAYDAAMGILERGDMNLVQMGMISAGWAPEADKRKYYRSGNLEPLGDGSRKKPFITMQTQW